MPLALVLQLLHDALEVHLSLCGIQRNKCGFQPSKKMLLWLFTSILYIQFFIPREYGFSMRYGGDRGTWISLVQTS
jgi:hypothetical protein